MQVWGRGCPSVVWEAMGCCLSRDEEKADTEPLAQSRPKYSWYCYTGNSLAALSSYLSRHWWATGRGKTAQTEVSSLYPNKWVRLLGGYQDN